MEDTSKRLSRRAFMRALGAAGGTALASAVLAACGGSTPAAPAATSAPAEPAAGAATAAPAAEAPTAAPAAPAAEAPTAPAAAGGDQEVSLLWSDINNARAPLIEDFTKATGIKVNQTIVEYNAR